MALCWYVLQLNYYLKCKAYNVSLQTLKSEFEAGCFDQFAGREDVHKYLETSNQAIKTSLYPLCGAGLLMVVTAGNIYQLLRVFGAQVH